MAFKPDYGLQLMKEGASNKVDHHFYDFKLYSLTVLRCGEYSTMVEIPWKDELYALSLDFNQEQYEKIISKASPDIAEYLQSEIASDAFSPRTIDFEGEITFGVQARLGKLQHGQYESFVPFIAQEIL